MDLLFTWTTNEPHSQLFCPSRGTPGLVVSSMSPRASSSPAIVIRRETDLSQAFTEIERGCPFFQPFLLFP